MNSITIKLNPIIGGLMYSTIFGLSFFFTKLGLEGTGDTFHLLSLRFLFAFLFMELLRNFKIVNINLKSRKIGWLIFLSILQPLIYYVCEAVGISLTSTSQAGIMMAFLPVLTLALAKYILKETTTIKQKLFILASLIGVLIININNFNLGVNILGLFVLFIMVLTAALFNVFSRKISDIFNPAEITYVMMAMGFTIFNGITIFKFAKLGELDKYFLPLFELRTFFAIIFLSIFSSVIAFLVLNYVLKLVEASKISVFSNFTTFIAILSGVVFLNESFSLLQGIGCLFILLGVWGVNSKFAIK